MNRGVPVMRSIVFAAALAGLVIRPSAAMAEKFPIISVNDGSFTTHVSESPSTQPPYIQVVRSSDGLDNVLSQFERLRGSHARYTLDNIRRKYGKLDYSQKMLLTIFTQPASGYSMRVTKAEKDESGGVIKVEVKYSISSTAYKALKKSVYFILLVTPKSDLPVMLITEQEKKGKVKARKMVEVTGVLMEYGGGKIQLVAYSKSKGKRKTYYIKEPDMETLAPLIGMKVTLEGEEVRREISAYEKELIYERVVQVEQ